MEFFGIDDWQDFEGVVYQKDYFGLSDEDYEYFEKFGEDLEGEHVSQAMGLPEGELH